MGAATFLHRVAPRFGAAQSFDEHGVLRFTSWACCQAAARERRGRRVATRREPLLRGGRRILTATLHLYAIPHRARVLKGPAPPCEGRFVSPNECPSRQALKPYPDGPLSRCQRVQPLILEIIFENCEVAFETAAVLRCDVCFRFHGWDDEAPPEEADPTRRTSRRARKVIAELLARGRAEERQGTRSKLALRSTLPLEADVVVA